MICKTFMDAMLNDAQVTRIVESGGTCQDAVIALVNEKARLFQRIIELERIAPKKLAKADGSVLIWHCPDDLIPTEYINDPIR